MTLKSLLLVFGLATSLVQITSLSAQALPEQIKYRALVIDAKTQSPIPFATAQFQGQSGGAIADENGRLVLEILAGPLRIKISALGYVPQDFVLERADSLYQLALSPDNDLPLITVEGKAKQLAVARDHLKNHRVVFITNWGREIIVTYRRGMTNDHKLVRFDDQGRKLEILPVEIKGLSAVTSRCADRLYLITGHEAIVVDRVGGHMQLIEKITRDNYDLLFTGCKLKADDWFVFEQRGFNGLLRRSSIQQADGEPTLFHVYRSPVLQNYFKDRYLIASNQGIKDILNVDRNIHGTLRDRQSTAIFLETIMYTNDQVNHYFPGPERFIQLDFANRWLRHFSWEGELLLEQKIPQKAGGFDFRDQVIQDPANGRLYGWSKDKDEHVLFEISPNTSSSEEEVYILTNEVARVPLTALEDIRILNGRLYALGNTSQDQSQTGPTLYKANLQQLP